MIWFSIKKIEKKIVENEFSDEEGFKYFLAFSILGVLISYIGTSEDFITFLEMLIITGITIWGSYSIFRTNSSGDGQDFFKRYFALSWVIGFRLIIFTLIITIPLLIVYSFISTDSFNVPVSDSNTPTENFLFMLVGSVFSLIYYMLLINSFKRVSSKTN